MIEPVSSWKNPEQHLEKLLTTPWYHALNKVFSNILSLTHDFYKTEKITPTIFPITTGSISSPFGLGSDSLPVKINIKNNEMYLADSMQFSLEIATRLNEYGAYYIMPSFRGEDMNERHLNEFVHSEVEIKGTLDDIMALAERYVKFLIRGLKETCADEIVAVCGTTEHLDKALNRPFHKIRFDEAMRELANEPKAFKELADGLYAITSYGERILIDKYGDFTWITHMPYKSVPFYQAREVGTDFSMTGDLLAGIGETLGCGQRVLTTQDAITSLDDHNVDKAGYQWYLDMRDIQLVQTSGFGMGLERFILWLFKHNDIRDCTLLLRNHTRVVFP
ncbi:MAG: asparaginase [Alphaproteobacteria bacterium]|nr:asparaginase [Alphaproteobacteria bacterium]